ETEPDQIRASLLAGDDRAWLEMLIAYYMGRLTWAELIDSLEDQRAFNASGYSHTRLSREGLLTEAYFYDALLARANHDDQRAEADLKHVVDSGAPDHVEYHLAKYLLRTPPTQPPPLVESRRP
ncbi:MAG TPA: hypothetical protein VND93_30425, partial [Myxococcales bacterium]|nr:hypothetical protein [Myxococcales bacterium]